MVFGVVIVSVLIMILIGVGLALGNLIFDNHKLVERLHKRVELLENRLNDKGPW